MKNIVEKILGNDFVSYSKVYQLAALDGLTKSQVRQAKEILGVKTITLVSGNERLWLWYIPKNVWNKYSAIE